MAEPETIKESEQEVYEYSVDEISSSPQEKEDKLRAVQYEDMEDSSLRTVNSIPKSITKNVGQLNTIEGAQV